MPGPVPGGRADPMGHRVALPSHLQGSSRAEQHSLWGDEGRPLLTGQHGKPPEVRAAGKRAIARRARTPRTDREPLAALSQCETHARAASHKPQSLRGGLQGSQAERSMERLKPGPDPGSRELRRNRSPAAPGQTASGPHPSKGLSKRWEQAAEHCHALFLAKTVTPTWPVACTHTHLCGPGASVQSPLSAGSKCTPGYLRNQTRSTSTDSGETREEGPGQNAFAWHTITAPERTPPLLAEMETLSSRSSRTACSVPPKRSQLCPQLHKGPHVTERLAGSSACL